MGLLPGQDLILGANVEDAGFARIVVEEAYRAGARSVTVFYADDQNTLARFRLGSEEAIDYAVNWMPAGTAAALEAGAAYLRVGGQPPSLLKDIDPDKVARSSKAANQAARPVSEAIVSGATNWCVVPSVGHAWAALVYPSLPVEEAVERLWEVVFAVTRCDRSDPIREWDAHVERVNERVAWLNDRRFDALRFVGPGTDLTVGLVEGHVWCGVQTTPRNGAVCSPNIPTEEVFTMPHRARVDGTVRATKPLSLRGQLVDGIAVEFAGGEVTSITATEGLSVLEKLVATDAGARRLGEVALVPHSSPVSQTGLLFYNTLFDENASSHIALGASYGETMEGYDCADEAEREARGSNDSMIHVDWMIGSDKVDVDGVGFDGVTVPVMRGGEWVN